MGDQLTFLGTGNFSAPSDAEHVRYWNSFVVSSGATVLVEPSPTALPNLRRAGFTVADLDVVMISHFHPDHSFGWPYLLFEALERGRTTPLYVVGPKGVKDYLGEMMRLGALGNVDREAHDALEIHYVEADPAATGEKAGPITFSSVEVAHVPQLTCLGYLLELEHCRLAYSGDTQPCAGLDELAGACDVLVLECAGMHPSRSHMDVESVKALRERFSRPAIVATHLGEGVDAALPPGVRVPSDLEVMALDELMAEAAAR